MNSQNTKISTWQFRFGQLISCLGLLVILFTAINPASSQEPTYDYVSKLYLKSPSSPFGIGVKGSPKLFTVGQNGSLSTIDGKLLLQFASGYPFIPFGSSGNIKRELTDGVYPAPVSTWDYNGLSVEQVSMVRLLPGEDPSVGVPVAMVKLKVRNETVTKATVPVLAFLGRASGKDTNAFPDKAALNYPLTFNKGSLMDDDGNLVLYTPSDPKPDYQPAFVGMGYIQPDNGPFLLNIEKAVQTGPTFSLQFKLEDKSVKLEMDSLDISHGETIPSAGFDVLLRPNISSQPVAFAVTLNEQDLGFISKDGMVKDAPGLDKYLAPGTPTPWISWDALKGAAKTGTNIVEFTVITPANAEPVEEWRPQLALVPVGTARPDEVHLPGDRPSEEWVKGLAYPHDTLIYQLKIDPGASVELLLYVPYIPLPKENAQTLVSLRFDQSLDEMKKEWDSVFTKYAGIDVPMQELNDAYRAGIAEFALKSAAHTGPSAWISGINWLAPALDSIGNHEEAEKRLESLIPRLGKIDDIQNMSDNGIILWQAVEHYHLTGDRKWMEKHLQAILDSCEWIGKQRKLTKLPDGSDKIPGILPPEPIPGTKEKHYRCSLTDACNYLGLKSAALALKDFGHQDADKLLAEAEDYRKSIVENTRVLTMEEMKPGSYSANEDIRQSIIEDTSVPFVPMGPDLRIPGTFGSYPVFGPVNLIACGVDDPQGERAGWILRFAEKHFMLCEKVGGIGIPLGVPCLIGNARDPMYSSADLLYATEYAMAYLYRDEVEKFIAAFYAVQAYKGSYDASSAWLEMYGRWLTLLKNMLVREDGETLRICQAIPREWLETGKKIKVDRIRTHFGEVSFTITSELVADRVILELTPPSRKQPKEIKIRFRHPRSRPIRSVELDGQDFNGLKGEEVTLTDVTKPVKMVVRY